MSSWPEPKNTQIITNGQRRRASTSRDRRRGCEQGNSTMSTNKNLPSTSCSMQQFLVVRDFQKRWASSPAIKPSEAEVRAALRVISSKRSGQTLAESSEAREAVRLAIRAASQFLCPPSHRAESEAFAKLVALFSEFIMAEYAERDAEQVVRAAQAMVRELKYWPTPVEFAELFEAKAKVDPQAGLAKFAQYMLMLAAPPIVDGSARRNRTPDERAAYFREHYGAGV